MGMRIHQAGSEGDSKEVMVKHVELDEEQN